MITINRLASGIAVRGHAGYAALGQDIVCAGVSTLVQALIASLEELTADKIEYWMSSGTVDIQHGNLSERGSVLVDSFFVGIQMIAAEYPDHVICPGVEDVKSYGKQSDRFKKSEENV